MSPQKGRLAQDITAYSGSSQIQAYTQQLSLIHLMWGYQLGIFYSDEHGSAAALNDLSDWMGVEYAFLDSEDEARDKFDEANWSTVYRDSEVELRHYADAPPLGTASTKPTILVVSDPATDVYSNVFRLANAGLAPYSSYLLVEGSRDIDDFSLEELSRFDVLLLHGYQYDSGEEAWELLNAYVSGGGSLFIDTGWQYFIPEWEFENAPAVLPVDQLTWTNYGKDANYVFEGQEIVGDLDIDQFGALVWEDDPWSVSGTNRANLRSWGSSILSVGDNPLLAVGELGEGRVVWSGMNLISHILAYDNEEETRLLEGFLAWLAPIRDNSEHPPPLVTRDHPDRIDFVVSTDPINTTWLYWREVSYPTWHAYINDSTGTREVPIYRAGPGFMLMPLDTVDESASVSLVWNVPLIEKLALVGTIIGLGLYLVLVLDGLLLSGNGITWLKIAAVTRIPRPFLGEGDNLEWAERKRKEIHYDVSSASSSDQSHEEVPIAGSAGASSSQGENGQRDLHPKETDLEGLAADEEHNRLLASWLEHDEQPDDSWAEKVLGKEGTSQEN